LAGDCDCFHNKRSNFKNIKFKNNLFRVYIIKVKKRQEINLGLEGKVPTTDWNHRHPGWVMGLGSPTMGKSLADGAGSSRR
jgi:hypothetical protein